MKDQNGTVRTFDFDKLGRPVHDRVTTLGTGIEGAVRRLSREYEVRRMLARAASYDNATVGSGSVVNDVTFEYDTLALAVKEYQEHAGAKGVNTPYVGCNYDTSSAGGLFTKGSRPTSLRYPNGRLVHYDYASSGSTADAVNRIDAIKDNNGGSPGNTLAAYSYLGHGGIVQADYQEPDIRNDLAFGAGNDPYDGLDRFDRVTDLLWRNYGTSTDAVRIKHGYDRAGNRLWREDPVAAANSKNLDELYSYDGVYQLRTLDRGDLNANHDAITSKAFAEDWSLDATGNWCRYRKDDDGNGTWELDQTRSHDKANEITQIAGSSSHVAHDRCGSMTRTPKPDDWNAHFDLTYDAWNRLVKVMDGQTTVAEYSYDARNFRVKKIVSGTTRHFYYNADWQCLEERLGSSTYADRQFVWGQRYIDDLILRDRDADSNSGTGNLGLSGSGLEERLYCHQDANWNVVAIANTSGAAQERYMYDAYSRPTFLTGAFGSRSSSSYAWETLFAGYRWDSEVRFYCVRNRVLVPNVRWLVRDAIGYEDGMNPYQFLHNDPLGSVDPYGMQAKPGPTKPLDWDRTACPKTCKEQLGEGWDQGVLDRLVKKLQAGRSATVVFQDDCGGTQFSLTCRCQDKTGGPIKYVVCINKTATKDTCSAIQLLEHEFEHVRNWGGGEKAGYTKMCRIKALQECWREECPADYNKKMKQCVDEGVPRSSGRENEATIRAGCAKVCADQDMRIWEPPPPRPPRRRR